MAYQAVRTDPHGGHRIQRTVGAGVAAVRAEVYEAGSSAQEGTSMSWRKARGEERDMSNPWPKDHKGHWWSGWPGAYCMRCGADDPTEFAIGNNYYDPFTDKWDTE